MNRIFITILLVIATSVAKADNGCGRMIWAEYFVLPRVEQR